LQQGNFGGSWMWAQFLEDAVQTQGLQEYDTAFNLVPQTMNSWGIIPVNAEWARENPETAANVLRAIDDGDRWVAQNQQAAAELINDRYDIPTQQAFDQLGNLNFYVNFDGDYIDHYKGMVDYGASKEYWDDFNVDDTIVTEPMEEAFPDRINL
jgi:ABC-type nitrate/sulfonate/bicarbonate transport system substrate-binding protein